jgi:hypothetical protein
MKIIWIITHIIAWASGLLSGICFGLFLKKSINKK